MKKENYIEMFDSIRASEKLKEDVLNFDGKKHIRYRRIFIAGKIAIAVVALIAVLGASNLITWATMGRAWMLNVSDEIYEKEYERFETMKPVTLEDLWEPETAAQILNEFQQQCQTALKKGFVYQFEKILVDDEWYGLVHDYNYIKSFTLEELKGAQINDDYDWITIQGEDYYLMRSFYGDFKELDKNLPELPERTVVLRVFSKENYNKWTEIRTAERLYHIKNSIAIPISEGRVVEYDNDTRTCVRYFSLDECKRMEISDTGYIVRLDGTYYVITYRMEENGGNEIRLYPFEGYKGDVGYTEKPDQNEYFDLSHFGIE